MPASHRYDTILADSQYLARLALRHLLEELSLARTLTEARDEQELCLLLDRFEKPLVFLDYEKPGPFSLETILIIQKKSPGALIVILTADRTREGFRQALEFGVHAFLTKQCNEPEILGAFQAIQNGERFYCNQVIDVLMDTASQKTVTSPSTKILSPRELEIVQLTARGLVAKQIAESLNLSAHTVYTHRKNIMQKLKVKNASQLVRYAVNKGWIERD